MFTIKNPETLQKKILLLKACGKKIGFVPTMGYLHEGHLSLVRMARKECDIVAASIFVNPTQFGPGEDLKKYPRDIKRDKKLLKAEKVDYLFLPAVSDMYELVSSVTVEESRLSKILCGLSRPGHFNGVLTVVAKLFNIALPDKAYFGQKDLQQAYLIIKMCKELKFPVKIVLGSIIRETSGLAMSSRNIYLTEKDKGMALALKRSIDRMIYLARTRTREASDLKRSGRLILKTGARKVDYIQIVSLPDFQTAKKIEKGKTYAALCAAYVGKTRLIDNRIFKG